MKKGLIIVGICSLIIAFAVAFEGKLDKVTDNIKENTAMKKQEEERLRMEEEKAFQERLKAKADTAYQYAKKKGLDLNHAFLVDFNIHSGKNRFFVWSFEEQAVIHSSLCAHGTGNGSRRSTYSDIKFSNEEGSYCSSLGKYKTGIRSYSNYGINVHYKLHGLDPTNSNAYKRVVVLHSYAPVPESEIFPQHLPLGYSQGCPVINDAVMTEIDNMMKKKDKDVLLWVYN